MAHLKITENAIVLNVITDRKLHHIADYILSFLDVKSLCQAELVCVGWKRRITDGMLWKKLIEKRAKRNSLWKGLSVRRGWYVLRMYWCIIKIRNLDYRDQKKL